MQSLQEIAEVSQGHHDAQNNGTASQHTSKHRTSQLQRQRLLMRSEGIDNGYQQQQHE